MKQQLFFITMAWCTITGAVNPDDIFEAARDNDTKFVQQCINKFGIEILEKKNCFGTPPLHIAVSRNAQETVQLILREGGLKLLEGKDKWGNTPTHYAAQNNERKAVQFLLDLNVNIQAINDKGKTPVDLTWLDTIKQLFTQQQIKLNRQLLSAAKNNNLESGVQALNGGARIDACYNGRTALHHATLQGNLTFIKGLLGQGANPTVYDNNGYGELAIHIAAGEPERLVPFIEAAYEQRLQLRIKDK